METRVTPYRATAELLAGVASCTVEPREGDGADLRSRANVVALRLAATAQVDEGLPYARALEAWHLAPGEMWFLHAALAFELVPEAPPPTVGSCARVASALTGMPLLAAYALALGRLARLALISVEPAPPLHARGVRVDPRVLELALGLADTAPVQVVRESDIESTACDPALVARIADALAPAPVAHAIGARACIPTIVAVAAEYGWPTVLAGSISSISPGAAAREAALVGGVLVIEAGPLYHPAWRECPRGVLAVT